MEYVQLPFVAQHSWGLSERVIVRNAETVGQALQSGAEIAVRMTKYSAANIKAIVKSNIDRAEVTRTCRATGRVLARKASSMVLTGSHVCCNTACLRILSISQKVVRGSLDAFIGYAQRISVEFVCIADELTLPPKVTEWTDDGWVRRAARSSL